MRLQKCFPLHAKEKDFDENEGVLTVIETWNLSLRHRKIFGQYE
jgi:hypothetical protein